MLEKILAALERLSAALEAAAVNPPKAATGGKKAAEKPQDPAAATPAPAIATPTGQANTAQPAASVATAGQATGAALNPETVGTAMVTVANDVTRDSAIEILKHYGASGFSGVKPSDYPAFLADCQKALQVFAQSGLPAAKQRTAEQSAALTAQVLAALGIGQAPANAAAGLM